MPKAVIQTYGMAIFLMDEKNAPNKTGSVGKPQLLASVRLVGPDGKDVPAGETVITTRPVNC